jgi:asparagine synthase (glutamine-hydrolysing)
MITSGPDVAAAADVDAMLARFHLPAGIPHRSAHGHAAIAAIAAPTDGPVSARRGSLIVVFDGFVYNAADFGHRNGSAADVLLELIERVGFVGALERLNGDFAIALYDHAAAKMWLARDRFGVKPLYFIERNWGLAFASQPRALIGLRGTSAHLNRTFVGLYAGSHYRTFDNDPTASPFACLQQLPAGHYLEFAPGGPAHVKSYWTLSERPDFDAPTDALAAEYRDLLLDAVRLRIDAARRPAFTLSGGMDSSSVLAAAVRCSREKQHAFSAVYQDRTYDESAEIRSMLESAVAEWHPVRIGTPDVFSTVARMVRAHDEPVATATWLSHFLLSEQAAEQGFGSLFGGLGGDELNAGEYEYFFVNFADLRSTGDEETLACEVALWAKYHDHPIYRKNAVVAETGISRLTDLTVPGRCLVDRARVDRYQAAVSHDFFDVRQFSPVMDCPFRSYLKNRTYQDIFRETTPCCLRAEDRHASAFGLDHFDPFFDHRLVEFMFRIPGRLKIHGGVTKVLLREAMRGLLPEVTRTRIKKTGWNAPAHVWFSGAGLGAVRDLVASRGFRERGIYNVAEVERIIDEHEQLVRDSVTAETHMMFIWQLVNLELWLQSVA